MWHPILLFVAMAARYAAADGANVDRQGDRSAAVVVYLPATAPIEGEPYDLVVEVINPEPAPISLATRPVELLRAAAPEPGIAPAPVAGERQRPPPGGPYQLEVQITLPPRSPERHIIPRNVRAGRHVEVVPGGGGSVLVKVPLPRDAFVAGQCQVVVAMIDGAAVTARSRSAAVRCVPPPVDRPTSRGG